MTARHTRTTLACAILVASMLVPPIVAEQPGTKAQEDDAVAQVGVEDLSKPPAQMPPAIQSPRLPPAPAPGHGRMNLVFEGNRRWCTFPDDRVIKPPERPAARGAQKDRHAVFTFGYQFSVAAVERSHPAETLVLFESPVFRTAVYRQAAKLGKGKPKPQGGPVIGPPPEKIQVKQPHIEPSSLIPAWQEQYRCTTLPESIDLDVLPGTYDVYMAFDILMRSGNWTHRTVGFGTDIAVEAGRTTRVDARANIAGGARRELAILGAGFADPVAPAAEP